MKKIFGAMLVLMFVFSFGLVSATTLITGTVYQGEITNPVGDAVVVVSCAHDTTSGTSIITLNTTSNSNDGSYTVTFSERSECNDGDMVTVTATKGDLYGESEPGIVEDNVFGNTWDFAMVHVPMVPEFGFFIGMLTILSAVGMFFIVRKD